MHEMSLENLEAVTGGIVVSRAKEIYKYLNRTIWGCRFRRCPHYIKHSSINDVCYI